jgi:hypothetical protein
VGHAFNDRAINKGRGGGGEEKSLKYIMLSNRNPKQKVIYYVIPFTQYSSRKRKKKKKETSKDRKQTNGAQGLAFSRFSSGAHCTWLNINILRRLSGIILKSVV